MAELVAPNKWVQCEHRRVAKYTHRLFRLGVSELTKPLLLKSWR